MSIPGRVIAQLHEHATPVRRVVPQRSRFSVARLGRRMTVALRRAPLLAAVAHATRLARLSLGRSLAPTHRAMTLNAALFAGLVLILGIAALVRAWDFRPMQHPDILRGKLAHAFETHYDKEFPLKNLGVNLWAAIDYSLFKEGRPGVVVGRDGWLYTDEEFKLDNDSPALIERNLTLIDWVKRNLARRHITLLVALVPAKARVYPQHLDHRRPPPLRQALYARTLGCAPRRGHRHGEVCCSRCAPASGSSRRSCVPTRTGPLRRTAGGPDHRCPRRRPRRRHGHVPHADRRHPGASRRPVQLPAAGSLVRLASAAAGPVHAMACPGDGDAGRSARRRSQRRGCAGRHQLQRRAELEFRRCAGAGAARRGAELREGRQGPVRADAGLPALHRFPHGSAEAGDLGSCRNVICHFLRRRLPPIPCRRDAFVARAATPAAHAREGGSSSHVTSKL